jgi:hypothetical protein
MARLTDFHRQQSVGVTSNLVQGGAGKNAN